VEIFAGNITNLTDARYFAAWNVDYLAFQFDETGAEGLNIHQIQAILEWVEGPISAIELTDPDAEKAQLLADALNIPAVIVPGHTSSPDWPSSLEWIYKVDSFNLLLATPEQQKNWQHAAFIVINDTPTEPAVIKQLEQYSREGNSNLIIRYQADIPAAEFLSIHEYALGLYVSGSAEEKVGYKSYDHLDDLMELLAYE
jgi:phosphoribosylanthranilate isomerase